MLENAWTALYVLSSCLYVPFCEDLKQFNVRYSQTWKKTGWGQIHFHSTACLFHDAGLLCSYSIQQLWITEMVWSVEICSQETLLIYWKCRELWTLTAYREQTGETWDLNVLYKQPCRISSPRADFSTCAYLDVSSSFRPNSWLRSLRGRLLTIIRPD